MGKAVKARNLQHFKDEQEPEQNKRKAKQHAKASVRQQFEGKVFSGLSSQEKDDLLKAMAIQLGFIEE